MFILGRRCLAALFRPPKQPVEAQLAAAYFRLKQGDKLVSLRQRHSNRSYVMAKLWAAKLSAPVAALAQSTWSKVSGNNGEGHGKEGNDPWQPREPVARRVRDGEAEVLLPFESDASLLEDYLSIHGGIR